MIFTSGKLAIKLILRVIFFCNSSVIMKLPNFCRTSLTWAKLKIQNNQHRKVLVPDCQHFFWLWLRKLKFYVVITVFLFWTTPVALLTAHSCLNLPCRLDDTESWHIESYIHQQDKKRSAHIPRSNFNRW